jgi:Orsellinic acid/F9775 biosynthesis cluster protein D
MDNLSSVNKLVKDFIIYHQDLGLAICQPCQIAFHGDLERHFLRHHKTVTVPERQALVRYIKLLPGIRSIEAINSDLFIEREREAIPGLQVIKAEKCNQCNFLGADTTVERHCRDHGWVTGQRTICVCFG